MQAKFLLGKVVATPGALEVLKKRGTTAVAVLKRHVTGGWGDLGEQDKAANDAALVAIPARPAGVSCHALSRAAGSPIAQESGILRNLDQGSLYPIRDHTDNEPIATTVGIFHKRPERHGDVKAGPGVLFVGRGPSGRGRDELKDSVVLHTSTVPARSTRSA